MISVTSPSRYITSATRYHPRYQIHTWSDFKEFRGNGRGSCDWVSLCEQRMSVVRPLLILLFTLNDTIFLRNNCVCDFIKLHRNDSRVDPFFSNLFKYFHSMHIWLRWLVARIRLQYKLCKTATQNRQNILMTNDSLMKVKSIAECSTWSILQYF